MTTRRSPCPRTSSLLLLSTAAALLALGCSQQPLSAARPPAATSRAAPGRTLIAVSDAGALRLVTLQGLVVARTDLPRSQAGEGPVGAAGDFAAFVDRTLLKALHADGSVTTIGELPGYSCCDPVALSADGRQWLWSAYITSGYTVSSMLVLSTAGRPDRTIARQTTVAHAFRPYRWTPAGAVYEDHKMFGGYIFFDEPGPTWRIDPATGQPIALSDSSCGLADVAADGTTACIDWPNNQATLTIARPGGGTVRVPLSRLFQHVGAVSFRPGRTATELVVAGTPCPCGRGPGHDTYETDLVNVATGALHPFGPAGLRPGDGAWTWTADGSLIEYRPEGTLGGDPGVYLVAPGGQARKVFDTGKPTGTISG